MRRTTDCSVLQTVWFCIVCVNGDVRIEGTETSQMVQGFIQYCSNGVWSTVVLCTKFSYASWTINEGEVACRQLGYGRLYLTL